jgi:Fur family peroxide stress response transcriptional regulator
MTTRRNSKKRTALQTLICESKTHPSARWLYDRLKPAFPDLSLGTVYRNIRLLLEEGTLASAGVVFGEERFDGEPHPHPHAVCKRCGTIRDLPETAAAGANFAQAAEHGFTIDARNTVFYGFCADCKETTAKNAALR